MDPITYRSGSNARMGGVDITISLTPAQEKALGAEAGMLADWFHTALYSLAMLRTGLNAAGEPYIPGPSDWHTMINDLDHRLLPRLQGARDAVVREHARSGGTVADLALAMDVSRSTAQYRRETIIGGKDRPSNWERWATDGGPERTRRTGDLTPGQRVRVTSVPDGMNTDYIGSEGTIQEFALKSYIVVGLTGQSERVQVLGVGGFHDEHLEPIDTTTPED
ncbi:hypothetical protein [Streptomyces sp. NPDC051546]|uniref:hypothetical protein n=1 Tax=Streptomyces sp. NPDC051546 TaxID=3365655 RepID=UPI0037AAF855